ncbi:MAG: hypothetical protein BWY24_00908 [Microgenomates group bacterium ADurb.Bin219]|nr:MAG: hypothetical protein BWY24_00908 [Microgenomates group bacterium ADurb.Bin219]
MTESDSCKKYGMAKSLATDNTGTAQNPPLENISAGRTKMRRKKLSIKPNTSFIA